MKNSNECLKCGSKDIIEIPGGINSFGSGNNITWGNFQRDGVPVTRFLCGNCGFMEEYIDDKDDIEKLRDKFK